MMVMACSGHQFSLRRWFTYRTIILPTPVLNWISRLNVLWSSDWNESEGMVIGGLLFAAWNLEFRLLRVFIHWYVHVSLSSTLCCLAMWAIIFGRGVIDCFFAPAFARWSALSLPGIPMWLGHQLTAILMSLCLSRICLIIFLNASDCSCALCAVPLVIVLIAAILST